MPTRTTVDPCRSRCRSDTAPSRSAAPTGLIFLDGDGTNDSTMTFTGSGDEYQRRPATAEVHAERRVHRDRHSTITTNDKAPIFANGGPQSTTNTVDINVRRRLGLPRAAGDLPEHATAPASPVFASIRRSISTGQQELARPGNRRNQLDGYLAGDGHARRRLQRRLYVLCYGDGGVRLWVNGNRLCGGSEPGPPRVFEPNPDLSGGRAIVFDPHGLLSGRRRRDGQARMVERQRRSPRIRAKPNQGEYVIVRIPATLVMVIVMPWVKEVG